MSQEQFERETRYRAALSIAGEMLREGLITDGEFRQIDTMFAEKYLPVVGQLMPTTP